MNNAVLWRRLFIQSFGTDFDFNGRWEKLPRQIGTDDAKSQSKKPLSKGKRKLPSRDYKGGLVEMKKKKVLLI